MEITTQLNSDTYFMNEALKIAKYGIGRTSPNPMVGSIIVKDNRIVGQGWHRKSGTPHAEIHALNQAGDLAKNSTIYVTLEPCCHYGRTGPCSEAIVKSGIKRAVVAMKDPNPLVAGKGIEQLRNAGIEVTVGVLEDEAIKLNEVFIKWITTGFPFVTLKTAMSLDGKIASYTGHSKWITNDASRNFVHKLRDCHDVILVGIGTVLADDPSLTTRLSEKNLNAYQGKSPVRVIVDSKAKTPLTATVLNDNCAKTIIAVSSSEAEPEKINALKEKGAEVLIINNDEQNGGILLPELLKKLGELKYTSIFVEGGATINASFLKCDLVDRVYWFIAPKIIGGENAKGPIGGTGVDTVDQAVKLKDIEITQIDEDILVSANIVKREE